MRAHLYSIEAKSEISLKFMFVEITIQNAEVVTIWLMDSKMAD
jgi:hypothetical protein